MRTPLTRRRIGLSSSTARAEPESKPDNLASQLGVVLSYQRRRKGSSFEMSTVITVSHCPAILVRQYYASKWRTVDCQRVCQASEVQPYDRTWFTRVDLRRKRRYGADHSSSYR